MRNAANASLFDHIVGAREQRLGTLRPSALAVLRLIASRYFVSACTGRSAVRCLCSAVSCHENNCPGSKGRHPSQHAAIHWVAPNFMILASPTTKTSSTEIIQQRNSS